MRTLRDEGRSVIAQMQQDFISLTGISTLKIKHNNVLGYFAEVTATHAEKMLSAPLSDTFIHRQTTANQVRFTTVELSEMETKILNAGNHALEIEKRLYETLKREILDHSGPIGVASAGLAEIDLATGLADLAQSENWVKPRVDNSRAFDIQGAAIRSWNAPWPSNPAAPLSPMIAPCRLMATTRISGCSPALTWRVNRPSCGRMRSSP